MRLSLAISHAAAFLALIACPWTASAADDLKEELTAILTAQNVPGAGIAIVQRGHAPRVLGLGLADVASRRPVDEKTMFRTASVGKIFTALAVMRLVEDGKLQLNTPLRKAAPEIEFENPWEDSAPVRIGHLLEHTTGWDDIHFAEYAYDNRAEAPLSQTLAFHPHSRRSRWLPGSRVSYSNSGPPVAGYVVQKVSGRVFEDFVADHVFKPLRMDSATYFADANYARHGATLYDGNGQVEPYNHILYRPAGSTNMSAADMGKLLTFLMERGRVEGRQLFASATIELLENGQTSSAIGLMHIGHRGYRFSGHTGDIEGASTQVWYQPELGIGYVAMLNSGNQQALWQIRTAILDSLMGDIKPVSPVKALAPLWQGVDGLYMEINPRLELTRLALPFGAIRLAYTPAFIERSSVLARWNDKLLPAPSGMAIEPISGIASVTRATDPLAGDVVRIGESVYARVSPLRVYGLAALATALLAMSIASFLFAIVWIPRRLLGRINAGAATQVRTWPLLATCLLAASFLVLPVLQPSIRELGRMSVPTLLVMALSAAYGLAALAGLAKVARSRHAALHKGVYWFAATHAGLHACAAAYLAWHGLLGVRLWA